MPDSRSHIAALSLIGTCICIAALIAGSARAAEPIEGRWSYLGGTVLVSPTAANEFKGILVAGRLANVTCLGLGTEAWPRVVGSGQSYTGTITWFYISPCSLIGPGQATFVLSSSDQGQVCGTNPVNPLQHECFPITRAVACSNGLDDDADGDVDEADPGCDQPADTTEGPDAVLDIADVRVAADAGRAIIPATLSIPVGRPVTATVSVTPGSAALYADFYPLFVRAVCGLLPPTFKGNPKARTDGRQRCPEPRPPAARAARGGSPGVDRMSGSGGRDTLHGLGGNDTLRGLGGGDRLGGGRGNDDLWGGSGGDELEGGDGDDHLYGDLNADRSRSRGCERVVQEKDVAQRLCHNGGTNAGELVRGGSGNDTCHGRGGDDVLEGVGGIDRLSGDSGDDELFGRKGADLMFGGAGNDLLEGGQGADGLSGGSGNDTLNGGYGRDRLSGGPGNDTLNAGWGERGEIVDCGRGHDVFIYGPGDVARNCEITRKSR